MAVIGLCGAHRVGKTTLGRELAKRHKNVFFVETKVSEVLKENGLTPEVIQSASFDKLLDYQVTVLEHLIDVMERLPKNDGNIYVLDRTPVDALAYLQMWFSADRYAEIESLGEEISALCDEALANYMKRAFEACVEHINAIVMVLPGIPVVPEKGKAVANESYIEHLTNLMIGIVFQMNSFKEHDWCRVLPRKCVSLEDRIETLGSLVVYLSTTDKSGEDECTTQQIFQMN